MVQKEKIIFIGPTESAITLMGDKKESKVSMEKMGVPLIPGFHGDKQDVGTLKAESKKIGYPVLIKASAGGGGKGMRIVENEKDFEANLEAARREAMNAFGDDRVLLEKYILKPRHIEVQVMSDSHGNHLHFFERECSIQRRYQKVIEETPSVVLDDSTRKKICETAVQIAKGIGYLGAGTVEFILDQDKKFYFLEMNTRLQVEHPITEMVTGFDLVKLQIEVAQGDKLKIKQEDITQKGHSIECRIYAEDPDNEFLPTNGKILEVGKTWLRNVRLDCGYKDGNDVSTQYDPMLAKLVVHSQTRDNAIQKMMNALADYSFRGVKTNSEYLSRILAHKAFVKGETYTDFVKIHADDLKKEDLNDETVAAAIAAYLLKSIPTTVSTQSQEADVWQELGSFRNT